MARTHLYGLVAAPIVSFRADMFIVCCSYQRIGGCFALLYLRLFQVNLWAWPSAASFFLDLYVLVSFFIFPGFGSNKTSRA